MSEQSSNSTTSTESQKSSSSSSPPASPASTSTTKESSSTPVKSSKATTSSSASKADNKPAAAAVDSHKRENSSGSLSSLKASLEKVKSAATNSDSPAATSASTAPSSSSSSSSSTNWTSVLTFGLASSKGKGDISEWLPDLTDKLPSSLFTLPPHQPDGKPAQPALPTDAVTAEFPNFTSLLPPPPPPSSALRFGWIDEYGEYHPAAVNSGVGAAAGKLNVKLIKAREQAKELIASVMAAQEKLEKDKEPHSPRMSAIVKERLSIEGEKKDSRGQGVERLVQMIAGSKGEKKVVVTEDEKVPEDL